MPDTKPIKQPLTLPAVLGGIVAISTMTVLTITFQAEIAHIAASLIGSLSSSIQITTP